MTMPFPDEILLAIIKEITSGPRKEHTRAGNLLALQLTSKQCLNVATEVQYHSVNITGHKQLHLFLHNILYYPLHMVLVKHLKLDWTTSDPAVLRLPADHHSQSYDPEMLKIIAMYRLEDEGTDALHENMDPPPELHLQVSATKALVAICTLQELETLQLNPSAAEFPYFTHKLATLVFDRGHEFPKLHALKAELCKTVDLYGTRTFFPLFMMRPVTNLIIENLNQHSDNGEFFWMNSQLQQRTSGVSTVEKLVIIKSSMTQGCLMNILTMPRALKHFEYQDSGSLRAYRGSFPGSLLNSMSFPLLRVLHSLVILSISSCNISLFTRFDHFKDLTLGEFKGLRKVAIVFEMLFGFTPSPQSMLEALPNSLEVLYLRMVAVSPGTDSEWDKESYVDVVRELLAHKNEKTFPNLAVVCMGGKDFLAELSELAHLKGVSLGQDDHPESSPF